MAGGRAGPAAPEEGTEAAGGLYGGGGGSVAGQCGTLRAGAGGDGGRRGAAPRPAGGAGGPRSAARVPAAGRGAGAGGGGRAPAGAGEGGPHRLRPPAPARGRRRRSCRRAGGGERGRSLPPGGSRSALPPPAASGPGARRRSPAVAGGARAPGRARTKRRRAVEGGAALDGGPARPGPVRPAASLRHRRWLSPGPGGLQPPARQRLRGTTAGFTGPVPTDGCSPAEAVWPPQDLGLLLFRRPLGLAPHTSPRARCQGWERRRQPAHAWDRRWFLTLTLPPSRIPLQKRLYTLSTRGREAQRRSGGPGCPASHGLRGG